MPLSKQISLSAEAIPYGTYGDENIQLITLQSEQVSVSITNIGCSIVSIETPDKNGRRANIVAGFTDLLQYKQNDHYFGCVVGRYANRIAGGRFSVDGKQVQLSVNDGDNHLHGGREGFSKKIWTLVSLIRNEHEAGALFEYISPDGEEGYPGNLQVRVKYLLNNKNQLSIQYRAKTDNSTPVNLTNHSYFNLTGFETPHILDHVLHINAQHYTPKNADNIPTGDIEEMEDSLSFAQPKYIRRDIEKFVKDKGYDHNYVLDRDYVGELVLAAELSEQQTGRILRVFTDKPALQLYTGNLWDGSVTGMQGIPYIMHGGLALETQAFPDSPNQSKFPNTILHPDDLYLSNTIFEFASK